MSAEQRLGSDPLTRLKRRDNEAVGEVIAEVLPRTEAESAFKVDSADEGSAREEPIRAWDAEQVLDRLDLAVGVFGADGGLVYANLAWLALNDKAESDLAQNDSIKSGPAKLTDLIIPAPDRETGEGVPYLATTVAGREVTALAQTVLGRVGQPGFRFVVLEPISEKQTVISPAAIASQGGDPIPAGVFDQPLLSRLSPRARQDEVVCRLAAVLAENRVAVTATGLLTADEAHTAIRLGLDSILASVGLTRENISVDLDIRADNLFGEEAVLAAIVLMELVRLCLALNKKTIPNGPVRAIFKKGRSGGLVWRLFGSHDLVPPNLSFKKSHCRRFSLLTELIGSGGALLKYSGQGDELRVLF